jgi:hypothetical protein
MLLVVTCTELADLAKILILSANMTSKIAHHAPYLVNRNEIRTNLKT